MKTKLFYNITLIKELLISILKYSFLFYINKLALLQLASITKPGGKTHFLQLELLIPCNIRKIKTNIKYAYVYFFVECCTDQFVFSKRLFL